MQRGQGRHIDQEAGRRVADWLEGLIGPVRGRALNRVQERFHHLEVAAVGGHVGLRQQQPGAGPDHLSGEHRQPPAEGRGLAADVVDHIEVQLDDPGRPEHLPGRDRVPDGVVGQLVLGIPVGFQNSPTRLDLGFYAARSYSLMRPPRTGRGLIRRQGRAAIG